MKKLSGFLLALLLLHCTAAAAAGLGSESEFNDYIKTFTDGSYTAQEKACQRLEWAGLSDPRIFDLVEKNLLAGYQTADSRSSVNEMAWLTKALAFSGQEKYRNTIAEVAANGGHKKLRNYAAESDAMLTNYARWNPIINDKKQYDAKQSVEANRFANMLRSDELALNLLATKRIYHEGLNDAYLLEALKQATEKRLPEENGSKEFVDTVAWMVKTLATTRDEKYLAVVEAASTSAGNKKVQKYASKYLKKFR
jgi:hypothetical protein